MELDEASILMVESEHGIINREQWNYGNNLHPGSPDYEESRIDLPCSLMSVPEDDSSLAVTQGTYQDDMFFTNSKLKEEMETELKIKNKELVYANTTIEALRSRIESLHLEVERELAYANTIIESMRSRIGTLHIEMERKRNAIEEGERSLQDLRNRQDNKDEAAVSERRRLRRQIDALKSDNANMRAEIQRKNDIILSLEETDEEG